MNKKEIEKLIRSGDVIITTKNIIKEAVKEQVKFLYNGDLPDNRYCNEREYEPLSEEKIEDISEDVIDYITGN